MNSTKKHMSDVSDFSFYKGKTVLVTGGAGFLGSHLCDSLLNHGAQVVCVDNFFSGSRKNVFKMFDNKNFELLRHDVTMPLFVEVDLIFNLACPASPVNYQRRPVQTTKTNVMGMVNMLGLAKRLDVPIFQASTSEVYGDPIEHPQAESYNGNVNPIGPRACYDEGKRVAETLCFDYMRQYGVSIKVARIFNCYGPRMQPDDGRVVSNFIVQALSNKHITVFGDGFQTRSFCYVSDMVDGFLRFMNTPKDFTGPCNIGNPLEISILELAEIIRELLGSSVDIVHKELPIDDPMRRKPCIKIANEKLSWSPKINIKDGIAKTIEYFENLQ